MQPEVGVPGIENKSQVYRYGTVFRIFFSKLFQQMARSKGDGFLFNKIYCKKKNDQQYPRQGNNEHVVGYFFQLFLLFYTFCLDRKEGKETG